MSKQRLVEEHLERGIVRGQWKLLDKLPTERELALSLGVSRGTVRGALQALAGRGVLESLQGSGTRVRHVPRELHPALSGYKALCQRLTLFDLLMPPLVAYCVSCASPSLVLGLERLLPVMGLAVRNRDLKQFTAAQHDFFLRLAESADNPCFQEVVALIAPDSKSLLRVLQQQTFTEFEPLFAVFARILNALRHADADGAMQAVRVYTVILKRLLEEAPCGPTPKPNVP